MILGTQIANYIYRPIWLCLGLLCLQAVRGETIGNPAFVVSYQPNGKGDYAFALQSGTYPNFVKIGPGQEAFDRSSHLFEKLPKGTTVVLVLSRQIRPSRKILEESITKIAQARFITFKYCELEGVEVDLSTVGFFQWEAPFSNPHDHEKTTYRFNETLCGTSLKGFFKSLELIQSSSIRFLVIVGSPYTHQGNLYINEKPYWEHEDQLLNLIKGRGISLLELKPLWSPPIESEMLR